MECWPPVHRRTALQSLRLESVADYVRAVRESVSALGPSINALIF